MIEQMTHVTLMSKAADKDALLQWLYKERGFHVMPIGEQEEAWSNNFRQLPDDSQAVDARLTRIGSVVSFCQEHASNKPGFLDAMLPLKVVGPKSEIEQAVADSDVDALYDKTTVLRNNIELANENIARLESRKASIEQFAFLGDDLPKLKNLKNVALEVVAVSGQGGKAFLLDERITGGQIVAEQLFADQTHAYYALATPASQRDVLKELIDEHGLHVQPIPEANQGAQQEIALLNDQIAAAKQVRDTHLEEARVFSDEWLRKASLAQGHYESEKNLAQARNCMSASSHLFVTRGYIKSDNLPGFEKRLETAVPSATVLPVDAPADEEPPISLKWNKWLRPAARLVKMYGLPSYHGIDPTPYVASIFFIFVGICLGDALYGVALILLMMWLKKRYKDQAHLQDFFQCFLYCGIATIVVGFLTGSFAANLTAIIPGLEWLDRIRTRIMLIDPITDSQTALYIAIGLGVLTQIYGMVLRFYRDWRRGDKMGAISDGLLWICFLVFALAAGATGSMFFIVLLLLTVVGLILTQGRDQTSWFARIMVGVISLYGIVGAYGASAILGDLISYARLMALSLTSAALGSTFNMLAELSVGIPMVGVIVAVLIIIFGHLMNFFLSLLSAFVHCARLMMLEFFGRFYEAGGTAYRPYGFSSANVDVKRESK